MSKNIYEIVTERIIAEMEKGIIPWKRPWTGVRSGAYSHVTGKPYSMLNQYLLSQEGEFLTFKQVQAEGGKVLKGSRSGMVVFFKPYKVSDKDANGKQIERTIPLLRYYNVFHISSCLGIESKFKPAAFERVFDPIEEAERIANDYCKREGIKVFNAMQNQAFYNPMHDQIALPLKEQFTGQAEYYSTLFHELGHSTGAERRLNRFSVGSILNESKEDYSMEELISEISATTILSTINIETENSFKNSTAYIQSWVQALRNDTKMIVRASSKAQKAVELIMNVSPKNDPEIVSAEDPEL